MYVYIILVTGTVLGALGGFFFKKCTSSGDIKGIIFSPFLYLGGATYLVSAILNIIVLRYLPYSIVLPLTSLTYIWSLILSYLLLNFDTRFLLLNLKVYILLLNKIEI